MGDSQHRSLDKFRRFGLRPPGSVSNNQGQQNQVALPQQQPIESPANVIGREPVQNEIRRSLGR
jgi:hypothetical protein